MYKKLLSQNQIIIINKDNLTKLPTEQKLWYEYGRNYSEYDYEFSRLYRGKGEKLSKMLNHPKGSWLESGCGNCNSLVDANKKLSIPISLKMTGVTYEVHPQTDKNIKQLPQEMDLMIGEATTVLSRINNKFTVITDFCGPYHYAYYTNTYKIQLPIKDSIKRKLTIITSYLNALEPTGQAFIRKPDRFVNQNHPAHFLEDFLCTIPELNMIISQNNNHGFFLLRPENNKIPSIIYDHDLLIDRFSQYCQH